MAVCSKLTGDPTFDRFVSLDTAGSKKKEEASLNTNFYVCHEGRQHVLPGQAIITNHHKHLCSSSLSSGYIITFYHDETNTIGLAHLDESTNIDHLEKVLTLFREKAIQIDALAIKIFGGWGNDPGSKWIGTQIERFFLDRDIDYDESGMYQKNCQFTLYFTDFPTFMRSINPVGREAQRLYFNQQRNEGYCSYVDDKTDPQETYFEGIRISKTSGEVTLDQRCKMKIKQIQRFQKLMEEREQKSKFRIDLCIKKSV